MYQVRLHLSLQEDLSLSSSVNICDKNRRQDMWNNFLIALEIMGKGMAGIFAVVIIITLVVLLLGKLK